MWGMVNIDFVSFLECELTPLNLGASVGAWDTSCAHDLAIQNPFKAFRIIIIQ